MCHLGLANQGSRLGANRTGFADEELNVHGIRVEPKHIEMCILRFGLLW